MTSQIAKNPFRPARVEYEPQGFLWVSPLAKRILLSGQPVYLGGARGSGKTSILRTLSTRDQLLSPIIKEQLPDEASDRFSVLLRVPVHLETLFRNAERQATALPPPDGYQQFSRLLELHIVKAALDDLVGLEEQAVARTHPILFGRAAKAFARHHNLIYDDEFDTLDSFKMVIERELVKVQRSAARSESAELAATQHIPGAILSSFATLFLPTIAFGDASHTPTQFRVCIDECEFLSPSQQRYLNSLIRSTEFPLSWVVAFVPQKYDRSRTVFDDIVLSGSDRMYVPLDDIDDNEFERLCAAVTALRLFYAVPATARSQHKLDYSDKFFNLKQRLGYFSLGRLAYRTVAKSLRRDAPELLEYAAALRGKLEAISGPSTMSELEIESTEPPVHLAYALKRLGWKVPSDNEDARRIASFKAALRKKARAGFLGLCRQYKVRTLPYAGYRIVVGLADTCIRDYLNIMACVFDAEFPDGYNTEQILQFISSAQHIAIDKQIAAITQASEQKYLDLPQFYRSNVDHGQRMIDALGGLTYELQTGLTSRAAMTLPERGIFKIDLSDYVKMGVPVEAGQRFEQLIRIGRVEGYLRDATPPGSTSNSDEDVSSRIVWVRLHRLLAPHFGFSYRGALQDVNMPSDLWLKLLGNTSMSAGAWINDALKSLEQVAHSEQEELPFV